MEDRKYEWRFCGQISYGNGKTRKITEEEKERGRRMRAIEILQEARELGENIMEVWEDE